MNFLFSTRIGRLAYLGRFALSALILALGWLLFAFIEGTDSAPADNFYPTFAFSCLIFLPGLFYLIRFAVLARMESIGMPVGFGFTLLLPSLLHFLYFFVISSNDTLVNLWPWILYPLGFCPAVIALGLFFLPEDTMRFGDITQAILHDYETGEGRVLIRLVPLVLAVLIIAVLYDFSGINVPVFGTLGGIYHGLDDAQSMDNAQLARQISRGEGFATMFLRPYALTQFHDYFNSSSVGEAVELFPADRFTPGIPRILPDTYNAPGYPCLLAAWFLITRPSFDLAATALNEHPLFPAERWIPELNQIFMFLTALLVFRLGLRLFDQRVAWLALIAFLVSDLAWQYSITALSTSFLMFLVTGILFCLHEIFSVGEACAESEGNRFGQAWIWALILIPLLAAACLTRLTLLVLFIPLVVFLLRMPRSNIGLVLVVSILAGGAVAPWFWHIYRICGNPLGSNLSLLLYGTPGYEGNQIYCTTALPKYESLFKGVSVKELLGFRWHLVRAWDLLGSNPLILFFGASILYSFKRVRAQAFKWLLLGCAVGLIGVNNLCVAEPEPIGPWNTLVVLFPAMLVIGGAFFFILLDRLNLQIELINNLIIFLTLLVTAMPLLIAVITPSGKLVSYPPYFPGAIDYVGRLAQPEEWVTSDMPWATAWYSDHASLWLPDTLAEFEQIHDDVCPTGVLFITPVTLEAPAINLTSGEDKDWLPFVVGANPPANFPLPTHVVMSRTTPEYTLWSDRPRWQ